MNWVVGLKLITEAAKALAELSQAVQTSRDTGKPLDLSAFRGRDDAVSRALLAEADKQEAEGAGSG